MATFEVNFSGHLSAAAGLTALVDTRIYPVRLPTGVTLPAVAWQRIASPRENSIGGTILGTTVRVQCRSVAETYLAARAVATALRTALLSFTDEGNVAGVEVDTDMDDEVEAAELYSVVTDVIYVLRGDR